MTPLIRQTALAGILSLTLAAAPLRAEKADQDKPVNLEADRVSVDDVKGIQIFEGNVQLVKGTLIIRAAKIVVIQDDSGYQRGIATGTETTLPRFRQKREGMDEYIEGEGERIEHNAKTEKTEFFNRAWVKSGLDEVRGQFISYDAKTERYFVTNGPNGTNAKPESGERVRAVIQSRVKGAAPGVMPSTSAPLKGADDIANPRTESGATQH
jgi:lipopolysaccharide export system protein LptA